MITISDRLRAAQLYRHHQALIVRAPEILSRAAAARGRRIHWSGESAA